MTKSLKKPQKLPKIGKLQKECDTLIQTLGKAKMPRCEACGVPSQVIHHWIEKSRSSNLRYNWENLIPLCNPCHSKIHNIFGNSIVGGLNIAEVIINKRGREWKERMDIEGRKRIKVDRQHYETIKGRLEVDNISTIRV